MTRSSDPFEKVRAERDPIRQAKLAGQLITSYQQRSRELARLRREAIGRAAHEKGVTFSAIAAELGLTRGRVTQIRQDAPPPEREFFGVGPVTVAVPLRAMPGRSLPVIASEDSAAAEQLTKLLTGLAFHVERFDIPTDGIWSPEGDVVAICGPKNSVVTANALESDPYLALEPTEDTNRWVIHERDGSRAYGSPMDEAAARSSDVAYVGRVALHRLRLMVIAGVHAIGSVGAVDYLTRHLPELHSELGTRRFSMVVGSDHDANGEIVRSYVVCPPRPHE